MGEENKSGEKNVVAHVYNEYLTSNVYLVTLRLFAY